MKDPAKHTHCVHHDSRNSFLDAREIRAGQAKYKASVQQDTEGSDSFGVFDKSNNRNVLVV